MPTRAVGRTGIFLLVAALLVLSCARPATPPTATPSPTEPPVTLALAAEPQVYTPKLILDLPLGDAPDKAGITPAHAGGISHTGPRTFAVGDGGEIYILDHAHGRLMEYVGGKLTWTLPLPWLDLQGNRELQVEGQRVYLTLNTVEYALDRAGRILAHGTEVYPKIRRYRETGKLTADIAMDAWGNRYERAILSDGNYLRRVAPDGQELARAKEPPASGCDRYVTPVGGLYTLSCDLGDLLIHEVLPPPNGTAAVNVPVLREDPAPMAFGLPVPSALKVTGTGLPPVTVRDDVMLHNLWVFLSGAQLQEGEVPRFMESPLHLHTTLASGDTADVDLYGYGAVMGGRFYQIDALAGPTRRLLYGLAFTPDRLREWITQSTVSLETRDIPGSARLLAGAEKATLLTVLAGAIPTQAYSAPHDLDPPFPQYDLLLDGESGSSHITLVGNHYLTVGTAALVTPDDLLTRFQQWLPVPALPPESVPYLFLAQTMSIDPGGDLTRWKNTVVRSLLGVTQRCYGDDGGSLTLTFYFNGKAETVAVDKDGFTYAGRRYPQKGLGCLVHLNGVP